MEEIGGRELRIIYYAHPMETYWTYLEDVVEELVKRRFVEIYHIDSWPSLCKVVNENACKELKSIYVTMRGFVKQYEKGRIPESDAKQIAYDLMKILRSNAIVNNILLNPSTFRDPFQISETFKRKAYPHFCYGLIDHCDSVVAHGYIMNSYIKQIFTAWLKMPTSSPEVSEYCHSLLELISEVEHIWSPGTCDEIKYALKKGKEVFYLRDDILQRVSNEDIEIINRGKVRFDKYGLKLYNKIWQPIAEGVYITLTQLNYQTLCKVET